MLRVDDIKDEFLVCSICTREYDEGSHVPRILPCLHTFCQHCLKKLTKGQIISCPLCKQSHCLSRDGVASLAKDTTRRNLIDFIKVHKRSSDILCKDCPEDQTAADFCKECYIFMCPECTKAHKRSLASRTHTVLTIKELQKSGLDVFRRKIVCSKDGHGGQQLAFFCTTCDTSCCTACTVCDHEKSKGHHIINIQDLYKTKRAELELFFKKLDSKMSSAKTVLQQTEQELLNIDIKELELEKDIDDAFERCHEILSRRHMQLKEQMVSVCEKKKSRVQHRVESIEAYIENVANAKEFSNNVILHTDPSEFVPLHTTLMQRLKDMATLKTDQGVATPETPVFDDKRMETEFEVFCRSMGDISTKTQHKPLSISRGHTHIGLSSASTERHVIEDHRIGDISCPKFKYDIDTVHQYREVGENGTLLRNFTSAQRQAIQPGGRRLKKYRGVVGTRMFHSPGKYYFELRMMYNIVRPLDNINFVFEIGISRRSDIDHNYYVYDQPFSWSFCGQYCDDHKQVCVWCRHHGYNLAHAPLSSNDTGTTLDRVFGFLLNTDRGKFSIIDVSRDRSLFTFQDVDFSTGLWPVFGCHWPSKVKLEMTLKSGQQIENISETVKAL